MLTYDQATERVNLSTKRLERQPGDMTRNPAAVYAQAEETAKNFRCVLPQLVWQQPNACQEAVTSDGQTE